jgi:hypothetical protein
VLSGRRLRAPCIGSRPAAALSFGGYLLVSFLYFGLPVAAHPGRMAVGSDNDPKLFIWMFAWWPHAIAHGLNPIHTGAIWAPSGYDLAWATSIPALALVFAPLTAVAGPVVAFNTAAIVLPAAAAWTAFLLCRYLTRSIPASLVGGYLFGFSSYMLGHEEGHMHLTAVFLVPLLVLVLLRGLRGELGGRGLAVRVGALLAVEAAISTEVLATMTLALVVGAVLAFALVPSFRLRARAVAGPVVLGYGLAALLASPILYYALTDFISGRFGPTGIFVADAENLVVPTDASALGGASTAHIASHFSGNELEQTAYFGVPWLVLLALFFVERRRDPAARFLLVAFVVSLVAAFGSGLHVGGHRLMALPWALVANLPVFDNTYPERLTLYATLAAALSVALWMRSSRSPVWLRVALPLVVLVSIAPHLGAHRFDETLDVPAFVSDGDYRSCLAPNENVLALPYGYMGSSTLWEALAGFRFRLAGGEVGNWVPHAFGGPIVTELRFDEIPPAEGSAVVAFARRKGVTAILVDPRDPVDWSYLLAFTGKPADVGGLRLYRIGGTAPDPARCS